VEKVARLSDADDIRLADVDDQGRFNPSIDLSHFCVDLSLLLNVPSTKK
jgi:hypothetical protein